MKNDYTFEIIKINKNKRTAIVRYTSKKQKTTDIKVIFHQIDEVDYENFESLNDKEFDALTEFVANNSKFSNVFPTKKYQISEDELQTITQHIENHKRMIQQIPHYYKLNNNSDVLNKDRIVKHFLSYFEDVMSEHEDRDMSEESHHVKEFSLIYDYLIDVKVLVIRVAALKSQRIIAMDSTIIEECISGSNCESYDRNAV